MYTGLAIFDLAPKMELPQTVKEPAPPALSCNQITV
jgi:hypothetical protein